MGAGYVEEPRGEQGGGELNDQWDASHGIFPGEEGDLAGGDAFDATR
jgi:hypothetical protein